MMGVVQKIVLIVLVVVSLAEAIEEFHAHDPNAFQASAMSTYMDLRRKDSTQNLSYDGELLQRGKRHAIERGLRKSDEELVLRKTSPNGDVTIGALGDAQMLQLPGPEAEGDAFIQAAVNQQGTSSNQIMLPHEARAQAVAFAEDIGLGAISKAGALVMGGEGEWLHFAEKKLKEEENLDYQALLWEVGSEIAERKQSEQGGLNMTYEQDVLDRMVMWFEKEGGKLRFAKPVVSRQHGFQLLATEDVLETEAVIAAPFHLIMCRQTARNVMIQNRGRYLGDELKKAFEKDELWGLVIFVLHEYYKEMNTSKGSKWGPYLRSLRMRYLATPIVKELKGTIAAHLHKRWLKDSDSFMWWSVGSDGPCSPTTNICKSKPDDRTGDSRFTIHQIRWAYWVVKQNAVVVQQMSTGLQFTALIPFYSFLGKRPGAGGSVSFDMDGTIYIRAGAEHEEGIPLAIHPGNMSDAEFFLRFLKLPTSDVMNVNPHTEIKLSLPGVVPKGSKFHYCVKGTSRQQNRDDCKASYRSEAMFWRSKVLTEWRKLMNLPPRMQELRMWATRLHLYGGEEEMKLISQANSMIAGLPLPVDQMPAEEQLMLMGAARDNIQAALMAQGSDAGNRPPPQLYTAPDPTEDHEADRAMQNLATLALQAQRTIHAGNVQLNATQVVLNRTRDFFLHGVLPMAGLDELDMFLLKKIGMLAHCGFEDDMKIVHHNVTEELLCAMRVHLMNESEIFVFCPKDARVWEDNCMNVEFMNYTAISVTNEENVVSALRSSIHGLLRSYPTTAEEDEELLQQAALEAESEAKVQVDVNDENNNNEGGKGETRKEEPKFGPVRTAAIGLRYREKDILNSALIFLDEHEAKIKNGSIPYQLAMKALERVEADRQFAEHEKFVAEIKAKALIKKDVAVLEVNLGDNQPKANLTLVEGADVRRTVQAFCQQYKVTDAGNVDMLEKALRARIVSPPPLALMLGVVTNIGERHILAIPQGSNATVEVGVFCAKWDNSPDVTDTPWCRGLQRRVTDRLAAERFQRRILLIVPIDAPDGRKLQLVIHEGEQHDLVQFVSDFFQLYHMPAESIHGMAQEVSRRLPAVELQIPVGLSSQRSVTARFSRNDNVTSVVEGFVNFYELEEQVKIAIMKRARHGMAPGTYML